MPEPEAPLINRPDYESARDSIKVPGPPPEPDRVHWDKPAPEGPPTPDKIQIPKHLEKIVGFFNGIILDESLLLDLCLGRTIEVVKRNVESRMVGSDHFAGDGPGGSPYTPAHYAAVAAPLAVELYKEVLKAIEGRKEEYSSLLEEMTRERERNSPGGPRIVLSE